MLTTIKLCAEAATVEQVQADIFAAYDALVAVAYGGVGNARTQVKEERYQLAPAPDGGARAWYRGEALVVCPSDLDASRIQPRLSWLRGLDMAPASLPAVPHPGVPAGD